MRSFLLRRLKLAAGLAALFALNVLVFGEHWRGTSSFTFDFPMSYYAFTSYWIASLQAGEWPHWIPYQAMGYPAVMNPQLGLFYPPLWVFVVLGVPYTLHAANVLQVLHVLWGSLGAWCLSRRLFRGPVALCGGVAFALFGALFSNAQHPDIVRGYAWLPWLFWTLLLDDVPAAIRIGRRRVATRLRWPNLFLPVVLCCVITGAYPGIVISGLLLSGVYVVAQAAGLFWAYRDGGAWRDGAAQLVLLGIGIGMATVYLLPTASIAADLNGARSSWPHLYLTWSDFYQIVAPSGLVFGGDYSMRAMQIPAALLLFLPAARLRRGVLVPMGTVAALSIVMCVSELRPIADRVTAHVPVLRLSRFPAGDYRIFLVIVIWMFALSGLERVSGQRGWRRVTPVLSASAFLFALVVHLLRGTLPDLGRAELASFAFGQFLWLVPVMAGVMWSGPWVFRGGLGYVVALAVLGCGLPTLSMMKAYWSDPNIEHYLYGRQGIRLTATDGRVAAADVFARRLAQRPARTVDAPPDPDVYPVIWRGYLDGSFMMRDLSGATSVGRATVEQDGRLKSFMERPGQLVAVPCQTEACSFGAIDGAFFAAAGTVGVSRAYGRNDVTYDVDVAVRSLVVENEMAAPGWTGVCDVHGERLTPQRVAGALRGWVLGPGHHTLRATYQTPGLARGAVLTLVCSFLWLTTMVVGAVMWRRSRHDQAAGGQFSVESQPLPPP